MSLSRISPTPKAFGRLIAAAGAAVMILGLAACGGEEAPKAKDAWNASQESAGKYKSMDVKASGKSNGKPASTAARIKLPSFRRLTWIPASLAPS